MTHSESVISFPKRVCAVCQSNKSRLLWKQTFLQMSSGSLLSGYDVVICENCGFAYADHIPDQTTFDVYYRDMSKYEDTIHVGPESSYDAARFQTIASFLMKVIPQRTTRILEIGSATGQLLGILKKNGYVNVMGLDPSPRCAEIAEQIYCVPTLTNTLSDASIQDGSVDFLMLGGVLEHVRDLSPSLAILWKMLSEDGQIFISVPDASNYPKGDDAPFQEFSVEHINYFSPVSLTNIMHVHGFEPVTCEQTLLHSNPRTSTPVLFSVYQKVMHSASASLVRDTVTSPALDAYIEKSRREDAQIRETIEQITQDGQSVIIWGTGAHTLRLLATSSLADANIRAFVDSNPRYQGKELLNKQIIAPEDLIHFPNDAILISSRVYQAEIAERIRADLKLPNSIITLYRA